MLSISAAGEESAAEPLQSGLAVKVMSPIAMCSWSVEESSDYPTAVLFKDQLFWINSIEQAFCLDANTGKVIYSEKMPEPRNIRRTKHPR